MKKKFVIIGIFIVIIIAISIIAVVLYNNSDKEIIDYTKYPEEEVYFSDITNKLKEDDYSYDSENRNVKNRVVIKCIDKNLEPIKEAKIEFYDPEGYYMTEVVANSVGQIALNNFENDTTYYFKQVETREGLVVDDTLYSFSIEYDSYNKSLIMVNSDIKLSKEEEEEEEEEEEILARYEQSKIENSNSDNKVEENTKTTYRLLSDNEREERISNIGRMQKYYFLKDDLKGKSLEFVPAEQRKKIDDNYFTIGYTVRTSSCYVLEYEIKTDDNDVTFLNSDGKGTNKFYDGEKFYIKTSNTHTGFTKLSFVIKIEDNGKVYKISKDIYLKLNSNGIGRIYLTVYDESGDISVGEYITLYNVVNNTDDKIKLMRIKTGKDGKIDYYSVPFGKYVLSKFVDGQEVFSDVFEVKSGDATEMKF